jgi:predicted dienelactone hydrolase
VLILAAVAPAAAACGGDDDDDGHGAATTGAGDDAGATVTPPGPGQTGGPGTDDLGIDGPYTVGLRTFTAVDPSRPTDAAAGADPAPERTLPVDLLYPATGALPRPGRPGSIAAPAQDAAPERGAFPLVVMAHGVDAAKESVRPFAAALARAGYVVAVPTFPLSRTGVGDAGDFPNQPGDLAFVLDQVILRTAEGRASPLAGHVVNDEVAVAGHDLGATTAFALAYNSCCRDERVDAVIGLAGAGRDVPGGTYDGAPATPLLVAQGGRDRAVAPFVAEALFTGAQRPAYYLFLPASDHTTLLRADDADDADAALLVAAAVAFLDDELKGAPAGLDAIRHRAEAAGEDRAEWRMRP